MLMSILEMCKKIVAWLCLSGCLKQIYVYPGKEKKKKNNEANPSKKAWLLFLLKVLSVGLFSVIEWLANKGRRRVCVSRAVSSKTP